MISLVSLLKDLHIMLQWGDIKSKHDDDFQILVLQDSAFVVMKCKWFKILFTLIQIRIKRMIFCTMTGSVEVMPSLFQYYFLNKHLLDILASLNIHSFRAQGDNDCQMASAEAACVCTVSLSLTSRNRPKMTGQRGRKKIIQAGRISLTRLSYIKKNSMALRDCSKRTFVQWCRTFILFSKSSHFKKILKQFQYQKK